VTERPRQNVVNVSGASEFSDLPDGRVRITFPLFGITAEGSDRDDALKQLFPILQAHLEASEDARRQWQEWVPNNIVEREMTDEEIAERKQMDDLVAEGKKIGKTFRALEASDFAGFVASSSPVIVDFWAEWCRPCHMLAPVLKEVCDDLGIAVGKLNIDENPDIWEEIPNNSIPTIAVYRDGQRRGIVVGAGRSADELKAELEPFLS
jgi:thioredoxin 1